MTVSEISALMPADVNMNAAGRMMYFSADQVSVSFPCPSQIPRVGTGIGSVDGYRFVGGLYDLVTGKGRAQNVS